MSAPWLQALDHANHQLVKAGSLRHLQLRTSPNAPVVEINGTSLLAFCSNDYLGLSNHPTLKTAMAEGARYYGVGSGASALISGHSAAHDRLEQALAQTQSAHIPEVKACFINTGFMANMAMISALATLGSASIYSDELNHASLIDGIRLAKAQSAAQVFIYPHNDMRSLERLLGQDPNPLKLLITDSVFSMDGDLAPIHDLIALSHQYHALLYLDDAHGFGVLGKNGHGTLELVGANSANILYMGTLGKAVGVSGAFIAAKADWIAWLIQKARPVIYSTSASPAIAHTVLHSLALIESQEGRDRRNHLMHLIDLWRAQARFQHWQVLPSSSAIQPIIIGSNQAVLEVAQKLREAHIWVPAIRPPTVPKNTARLRVTLQADHTIEQLERLIQTLQNIEKTTKSL